MSLFKNRLDVPDKIVVKKYIANLFDSDWMNSVYAGSFLTYSDAVVGSSLILSKIGVRGRDGLLSPAKVSLSGGTGGSVVKLFV